MKAHRLFPCLFPVLAVATLLPSASFAPTNPPGFSAEEQTPAVTASGDLGDYQYSDSDSDIEVLPDPQKSPAAFVSPSLPTQPVREEEPSSLQGAVGGASAQPDPTQEMLQQILQQQTEQAEVMKKLQAEAAALAEQLEQSKGAAAGNVFENLANQAIDTFRQSGDGKKFQRCLQAQKNANPQPDAPTQLVNAALSAITIRGKSLADSLNEVAGASASSGAQASFSQSASKEDLQDVVKTLFGGSRNSDRSATDRVGAELLKGFGKFKF